MNTRGILAAIAIAICLCRWISAGEAEKLTIKPDGAFRTVAILRHDDALNEAHDVELQGDYAYVAGKGGSIAVIDIADAGEPEIVWFRRDKDSLADSETVLLAPGRLLLGAKDFHSIDISDPRQPVIESSLRDRTRLDTINGMVRRGDTIFAASKRGIVSAIDVSNPKEPRIVGLMRTRERFQFNDPHDIDLLEEYLVVVDPNRFGRNPASLAVIRVFDESGVVLPDTRWTLAGRISTSSLRGANRVQVHGDYAFVAGSLSVDLTKEKPLAKGTVVDLSRPESPRQVASVDFPDKRGPNGLTIAGNVWFLAGGQTVQAYDVRDPRRPKLLASVTSPESFPTADDNAHDLVFRNGYLYVTSQGDHGLVIIKVEDPKLRKLAAGAGFQ